MLHMCNDARNHKTFFYGFETLAIENEFLVYEEKISVVVFDDLSELHFRREVALLEIHWNSEHKAYFKTK